LCLFSLDVNNGLFRIILTILPLLINVKHIIIYAPVACALSSCDSIIYCRIGFQLLSILAITILLNILSSFTNQHTKIMRRTSYTSYCNKYKHELNPTQNKSFSLKFLPLQCVPVVKDIPGGACLPGEFFNPQIKFIPAA
jgi:hypothetical protein